MGDYIVFGKVNDNENISEARGRIIKDLTSHLGCGPKYNSSTDSRAVFSCPEDVAKKVRVYSVNDDGKGNYSFNVNSRNVDLKSTLEASLCRYKTISLKTLPERS